MPDISPILPFEEAMRLHLQRNVFPSALTSAEQRAQFAAGFHRSNFTSAQTTIEGVLDRYKENLTRILNPETVQRADGTSKTEVLDVAKARLQMKEFFRSIGYTPNTDDASTIKDLASDARINLVIKTNRDVMQGAGNYVQANDPAALDAFPCQELVRIESRKQPRDWRNRFRLCAQVVGDVDALRVLEESGRMIARKDSGVWQALGDGEDGSTDTLGNPFPPFAFGSGMDVRDISYSESVKLGLIERGQEVKPSLPADLSDLFSLS